jgi:hypothetical protein
MTDIEILDALMPNWRTDSVYTDAMFLKDSKDKNKKAIMIMARAAYSKRSGKSPNCFCGRGMRIILEWFRKEVLKNEKNETNE